MDFIKGKHRLGLYLLLLAVLALGAFAAVRSVTGTGAYLTGEGDWQTLAGDYRIGTIDYTVKVNDALLLGRSDDTQKTSYNLAVPILGGVKMFDPDPALTAAVLAREFNEGATLARVRVTNYSKNMVDVTAQFAFQDQRTAEALAAGAPPIRVLPLPVTLNRDTAASFDCREYILDLLGRPATPDALETGYRAYLAAHGEALTLEMGILPGSTTLDPGLGDDKVVKEGSAWHYYKDVFLVVWSEYGDGEFNAAVKPDGGNPRQGLVTASFTVGQLD